MGCVKIRLLRLTSIIELYRTLAPHARGPGLKSSLGQRYFHIKILGRVGCLCTDHFVLNVLVYDGCFFLHFLIFNTYEEAFYLPETLIVIMQICFFRPSYSYVHYRHFGVLP